MNFSTTQTQEKAQHPDSGVPHRKLITNLNLYFIPQKNPRHAWVLF
jgi:hypothetical protein